jgi:Phosphotransferase enzyme family
LRARQAGGGAADIGAANIGAADIGAADIGAADIEDEELARSLVDAVVRMGGGASSLTAIRRRPFPLSTSYPAEIVSVELATSGAIDFFLKDFSRPRIWKDAALDRRERERRVYEDLLDDGELGTARLYGARWDRSAARFWLLLEFVDADRLAYCTFPHWLAAAAWLGRLHGRFGQQPERLRRSGYLVRHDADFFVDAAERALQAVSALSCALAQRVATVLEHYDPVVAVMAREPQTLVHGSYRPQNVLVVRSSRPPRICPTDWELAGFGRAAYDLAYLCDGFRGVQLDAMFESYHREADRQGLAPRDRDELRHEVGCFRLHKTISSLGHWRQWKRPTVTASRVVAAVEEIAGMLA